MLRLVPAHCHGKDAVHVGAHDGEVGVPVQLSECLADAHLLHVKGDAAQGRHDIEADDFDAGGELVGAVAAVFAELHVVAGVRLVGAESLGPGKLLSGIPEPNHGEDGVLGGAFGPLLARGALELVDGLLPGALDEFEVLLKDPGGHVPTRLQARNAMLQFDGVDRKHVLHRFGCIPAGAGVRELVLLARVDEHEVKARQLFGDERLRLIQCQEDRQAAISLGQSEDSA